jgi:hypothetical protein
MQDDLDKELEKLAAEVEQERNIIKEPQYTEEYTPLFIISSAILLINVYSGCFAIFLGFAFHRFWLLAVANFTIVKLIDYFWNKYELRSKETYSTIDGKKTRIITHEEVCEELDRVLNNHIPGTGRARRG